MSLSAAQRKDILRLQNEVRNALNVSLGDEPKSGVEPSSSDLKRAMAVRGIDVTRITFRKQRLPSASDLEADYRLYWDGELLFRLKLVPWDDIYLGGARWHVKRHPEATWWRPHTRQDLGTTKMR